MLIAGGNAGYRFSPPANLFIWRIKMATKYIAIQDCEYKGKIYRAGETALFADDVEIANLFWKKESEYLKEQEESRIVEDSIVNMSEEEKSDKIKELTKELKAAKKVVKPADTKDEK